MKLIPTLQLKDGKVVTLTGGRIADPVIWHVDPVATAKDWTEAGADLIQVTNLDWASDEGDNSEVVERIIREVPARVQLAGGFGTEAGVDDWINRGAARLVIGAARAARNPELIKWLARKHPDMIVLSVDVYQGRVMADAWRVKTAFEPEMMIREFDGGGLAAILLTDIDADIEETDASLSLITRAAALARTPLIASGMVRGMDDISRLKYVRNVAAALVGRPLLSRDIDLAEAMAVARAEPGEKVAEFR